MTVSVTGSNDVLVVTGSAHGTVYEDFLPVMGGDPTSRTRTQGNRISRAKK